MRNRVCGWRLRSSPLRRRSDVVEAWTLLAVAVLLLVVAPLAGVAAAWWVHDDGLARAQERREDHRRVPAEVVDIASAALPPLQGGRQPPARATVRWTDPAAGPRTTTARVPAGTRTGETVVVWMDAQGRNVPPPPGSTAIWQNTITLGVCATGGAVAVILLGHMAVRHTAMRHRLAEWDEEWARTEPHWTGRRA